MILARRCPITGDELRPVFQHKVLGKHEVTYYYSEESGILQTEDPYWLDEAYGSVISDLDTWIAARNFGNAQSLEPILDLLFPRDSIFVDVACGCGLLTRLMRDKGFNCYAYDKFCPNTFSGPYLPPPGIIASAVFAFEVFEHLMDPVQFLSEQLTSYKTDTCIASTTVFESKMPGPDWPYYSFETGQHLTFYQPRTLDLLARKVACKYIRLAPHLHLFSRGSIPAWKIWVLRTRVVRKLHAMQTRFRRRGKSLTCSDCETLSAQLLHRNSSSR